jgi:hypothetical protein
MRRSKQHLYSITSVGRASTVGGTSRPSALAVTRSSMIPELLGIRGFIHFALFLISFYFGFIRK